MYNVVSVSGGKDSTALLLLAIERGVENLQAIFADTGNEHPVTYEYVQYLSDTVYPIRTIRADFAEDIERKRRFVQTKWREQNISEDKIQRALEVLKPTGNPFLDLCVQKGLFPSTKVRFCSEELKRNPIIEQVHMPLLDAGETIWSWQGVRADESLARRDLPELEEVGGGLWNYRPILKWTAEQCFAMHKKHGIKHNPLYEQGMRRVGCMPCIHERKDSLLEISQRFPEELERIARWEQLVAEASKKQNEASFFAKADGKGENIWQAVEWAKTARGGKQRDMFREQNGPACSSVYGLCE